MTTTLEASAKGKAALSVLRQAVAKTLDRKQRLGQYAVIWKDGQPVLTGGEVKPLEVSSLLAEKSFLEEQLAGLPESARLTKMSTISRLHKIETLLAQQNTDER